MKDCIACDGYGKMCDECEGLPPDCSCGIPSWVDCFYCTQGERDTDDADANH